MCSVITNNTKVSTIAKMEPTEVIKYEEVTNDPSSIVCSVQQVSGCGKFCYILRHHVSLLDTQFR